MNTILVFLADAAPLDAVAPLQVSSAAMREWLVIFGAIGLVTLALLLWAVLLRKKRRRRHSHHHHHHHAASSAEIPMAPQNEETPASPEKHRRRRSHHRHRPRNPTLAETGGLPPIRPESPPEAKP